MKLFISYARVDKPLCKHVVERLQGVHEVWYDNRLHAGQAWWDEIQERLKWCEGFVYLLLPESVASEYCQKEYAIAADEGKHIFPVLIQARTEIPESLSHIHYADLSEGMEDIITLMNALTVAERLQRKVSQPLPKAPVQQPSQPPKDVSPNSALGQAADAVEAENYDSAVFIIKQALEKKPGGRIVRIFQTMLSEAEAALEQQAYLREAAREYAPIVELVSRTATRALGCEEFAEFQQEFPDYDPLDIAILRAEIVELSSPPETGEMAPQVPHVITMRGVSDILPAPFEWIEIPGKGYSIAKYPVTNAQFAKFIEAGGYTERRWWTGDGRSKRDEYSWMEPRYWSNWNGADHPVVGVAWYEALAFCLWLSDVTGENIILPTEEQWQYAAQGDDGRKYPWGDEWDCKHCNNSVSPCRSQGTTPVRQYSGKGDSPFGVVDMMGNVWEWCLTESDKHVNDINYDANDRVVRGSSWSNNGPTAIFRCNYRGKGNPTDRNYYLGFRPVCVS